MKEEPRGESSIPFILKQYIRSVKEGGPPISGWSSWDGIAAAGGPLAHKFHTLAARATHNYYLRVEEAIRQAISAHGGEIDDFEIITIRGGGLADLVALMDRKADEMEFVTHLPGPGWAGLSDVSILAYKYPKQKEAEQSDGEQEADGEGNTGTGEAEQGSAG